MSEAADAHSEVSPEPPVGGGNDGNWGLMFKLLAALNPVILLVVGFVLHRNIDEAKVQIDQAKLQLEENSAKLADLKTAAEASSIVVHDRVDKVKVISEFTDNLTSTDDRRRRIAIEAIFIALPDEAARLVKAVEQSGKQTDSPITKQDVAAAKDALDITRARLVADMFSDMKQTRVEALSTLERGWTDDAGLINMLLDKVAPDVKARADGNWAKPTSAEAQRQLASIYNTTEFLSLVRPPDDTKLRGRIGDFLKSAVPNSDDTRRLIATMQERFRT